ncbi:MAG: HAD-IIIA family hydrolase [Nanoarchaeota archaeon]|nr:HAD-IIIA family hydrolase [Nanoarchaeota archaeon]
MSHILIGLDRDNTLIRDSGYLGRDDSWKRQLEFCQGVVDGLKILKSNPRFKIIVATNQAGVALGYFPPERTDEINRTIDDLLRDNGVVLDGWYSCPYVGKDYATERGIPLDSQWVKETDMRKPGIGMLRQAASDLKLYWDKLTREGKIFFIGDKPSDVETGLNAKGYGIFVPMPGIPDSEFRKVHRLAKENQGRVHIDLNFSKASQRIINLVKD